MSRRKAKRPTSLSVLTSRPCLRGPVEPNSHVLKKSLSRDLCRDDAQSSAAHGFAVSKNQAFLESVIGVPGDNRLEKKFLASMACN
ncbi:unnamed protein product [Protopolystoma xenopodis]|uniref:Uncharacterized protein n=1 Tax=Protopolystoma xenopodis TaxID=117903 RepID=A0A3S5B7Q2_9PLAT|nr:unnamed protein product [Protopolystoma xenopodis]